MEKAVTYIGYIITCMSVYIFLFYRIDKLFYAWAISLPFTATAILNINIDGKYSSIYVFQYFSMLIIVKYLVNKSFKKELNFKLSVEQFYILLILMYLLFSLIYNIVFPTQTTIYSPHIGHFDEIINIDVSSKNFARYLYFALGASVFFIGISSRIDPYALVKAYSYGTVFFIFWGLFQYLCSRGLMVYPSYIFNTSLSHSSLGYQAKLMGQFRIVSAASEASFFAQAVLIQLFIIMVFNYSKQYIFSRRVDLFVFFTGLLSLILSTSATGLIGAFLLINFYIFITRRYYLFVIELLLMTVVYEKILYLLLLKINSGSFVERTTTILQAFSYFQENVIFGLGVGSVTSHDFLAKILVNFGIVGFLIFLLLVSKIYLDLKKRGLKIRYLMIFVLLVMQMSEFQYVYHFIWFTLLVLYLYCHSTLAVYYRVDASSDSIPANALNNRSK